MRIQEADRKEIRFENKSKECTCVMKKPHDYRSYFEIILVVQGEILSIRLVCNDDITY